MTLNLLAVVLLIAADASVFIAPVSTYFPAILGLGFEVLVVLNLLFALSWLFSHRKSWCVVSFAALLCSSSAILSTWSHGTGEAVNEPVQLRILSYNTMSLQNATPIEKNDVLRYIRESRADIVCLQEYAVYKDSRYPTFEGVKRYFLSEYPYTYFDFPTHNTRLQYGLAVYSRYPLINKQSIPFESSANAANHCDVVVPDGQGGKDTIRLFNNHLQSNSFQPAELELTPEELNSEGVKSSTRKIVGKLGRAYAKRAHQVQAVRQAIRESPYPVIVCGDFNDVPVSYTYRQLTHDLRDAFLETSWLSNGRTFVKHGLGIRIDYILHSPSFQACDFKVDRVNYSDHYPVSCTLSRSRN